MSGCYFTNALPGKVKSYQTNVIPFSSFFFFFKLHWYLKFRSPGAIALFYSLSIMDSEVDTQET